MADGRRFFGLFLPAFAAALANGPHAAEATDVRPVSHAPGPPFDLAAPTPHRLSFTFDTAPARAVAVGTGRTALPALAAAGAHALLTDFSDTPQALEAILG